MAIMERACSPPQAGQVWGKPGLRRALQSKAWLRGSRALGCSRCSGLCSCLASPTHLAQVSLRPEIPGGAGKSWMSQL